MRVSDSNKINFFAGGLLGIAGFFVFFCVCPPATAESHWEMIFSSIDTYYFTSVIGFILFSTGFAM